MEYDDTTLPPFLRQSEPASLDQLPLQVWLLTMELANLWHRLAGLEAASECHGRKSIE